MMCELLGMHWTLAVTLVAIVIMLLDLFVFADGGLSFLADVMFTLVILHFLPTDNWIWLAFAGVFIYVAILAFHLLAYRRFAACIINRFIAPQKRKSNNDILIGRSGVICLIDDRAYIHVEDEHIPCALESGAVPTDSAGRKAVVMSWKNTDELIVKIVE